jgi:HAD superfamily hydrolase (TIGR01509 family)
VAAKPAAASMVASGSGAVIFDLDGVLIDSEGLQYRAYTQVLARYGVRVSPEEYAHYWIADGRGPEYAVERYRLPLAPAELRARKGEVYHAILRAEVTLMPGVPQVLARLSPHFPLAIATNSGRTDVQIVLERFGWATVFRVVVAREDYAAAKPAADAYLAAAARLGLSPAQCLVLEDAPRGVVAAARAGALVVAIPNAFTRGSDFAGAAVVLDALSALDVGLVRRLLAARVR